MNKPENALLYLLVFTSLLLHLVAVLVIRTERFEARKEKEPIVVDLFDKVRLGEENKLPAPEDRAKIASRPAAPAVPERLAKAPSYRPSVPSIPLPVGPPARGGSPVPPSIPGWQTGTKDGTSVPSVPTPSAERPSDKPAAAEPMERPRKIKPPTFADLERYAQVEPVQREKKDGAEVVLDAESLVYFSYARQLAKRFYLSPIIKDVVNINIENYGDIDDTVLKINILKSGKLSNITMLQTSGNGLLDEKLKQIFIGASPYNPLPDSWKTDSIDYYIIVHNKPGGPDIYYRYNNLYFPGEGPPQEGSGK